ncbi:SDR family oxidoreductase [Streptomyces sp. NRRL F-5126]|uniref:SDR family oxidoreductase n=1 Tax=Streptomyces sp. NRRL F-5126 TaxID=1463857 RepID=UPI0006896080|nr:SDR family NAD(P)-dependent oxidoreductase [Streptomyces sp. NRRL F-5126]
MPTSPDASRELPLSGTVSLVTGASSGIGAEVALGIARRGGAVALVARRADRLKDLTGRIEEEGGTAFAVPAELSGAESARAVVDEVAGRFGRLDILVNNAGYGVRADVEDSDPEDWDRMVDVNVRAVLHLSRCALPHLLSAAAGGPRGVADLVTTGSVAGRIPRPHNSVYSATKHAVGSFTEALRAEVTGRGVRVGIVEPGMVRTEMTAGGQSSAGGAMPREKWLAPADVARSVLFMVEQPPHAAVNEIMVRPTAQEH